ncbi:IS21-like element helper ATPase IstB [Bacillus sp. ISL-40]|uniref:IS21-like element helper ATPase IstB n=1 Tax=unclassified Bacillus (in: firmicutes) TaxID=185979 RepID=UPI001BEC52D0|nr:MULTISPECIES: IS21-like element helper ATPase IstB [unclassified Bacillus (in: firmicutes)]MBT2700699.1 IS21-like element helper ATPase IstB [Bacillus sp. ISL-40]MBT2740717.1 IS21-like element helper ATPase IstB [Bacillus sp. ISL-77]
MSTTLLVEEYLKRLRLPAILREYKEVMRDAESRGMNYEEFLRVLLENEVNQRNDNMLNLRIRQAKFPFPKTIDSFDFTAVPYINKPKVLGLHRSEFIDKKENIILIGNSGTGKSHLSISLGYAACHNGYSVQFWSAAQLCNELLEAQSEKKLLALEKRWLKADLIILDDVGYIPFSKAGAQLLFQFCASRYEKGSMIITSNLEFSNWTQVFGDEQMTAALVDRLTHRSHILVMNGDSYRFKESLKSQIQ